MSTYYLIVILECTSVTHIGESKKKVLKCCIVHNQNGIKCNCQSSGATEHTKGTITVMPNMYRKRA